MTDQDTATELAIAYLRRQGYSVTPPQKQGMISPADAAKMAGSELSGNGLWRRLHHLNCPPYEKITSPNGRLIWLKMNPPLLAWLKQPKRQGVKTLAPT